MSDHHVRWWHSMSCLATKVGHSLILQFNLPSNARFNTACRKRPACKSRMSSVDARVS